MTYAKTDTIPSSYAPPWDVFTNVMYFGVVVNETIVGPTDDVTLIVNVTEKGVLYYKDFYVYRNTSSSHWVKYTFPQTTDTGDYISDSAHAVVSRAVNTLNQENWVLTYSCLPNGDEWLCGCRGATDCGKWSIQRFGKPATCTNDAACTSYAPGSFFCSADASKIYQCKTGSDGCMDLVTNESCGTGTNCTQSGTAFSCATCATSAPTASTIPCGTTHSYSLCTGTSGTVTGTLCTGVLSCVSGTCTDTCTDDSGCTSTSSVGCSGNSPYTCGYTDADSCLDKTILSSCGTGTCNSATGSCDACTPACPSASTVACGGAITSSNGCGTCSGKGTQCSSGVCDISTTYCCGDGTCNSGEVCPSDCSGGTTETVCDNNLDDDGDSLIDCADTVDCPTGTTCGTDKTCQDGTCTASSTSCSSSADCNDNEPCTTDTCTTSGSCSNVAVTDGGACMMPCVGGGTACGDTPGTCQSGLCVPNAGPDGDATLCENDGFHYFTDLNRWGTAPDAGQSCCGNDANENYREFAAYWNVPWDVPASGTSVACCDDETDCVTGANGNAACRDAGTTNAANTIFCDGGTHYQCTQNAQCLSTPSYPTKVCDYNIADSTWEWRAKTASDHHIQKKDVEKETWPTVNEYDLHRCCDAATDCYQPFGTDCQDSGTNAAGSTTWLCSNTVWYECGEENVCQSTGNDICRKMSTSGDIRWDTKTATDEGTKLKQAIGYHDDDWNTPFTEDKWACCDNLNDCVSGTSQQRCNDHKSVIESSNGNEWHCESGKWYECGTKSNNQRRMSGEWLCYNLGWHECSSINAGNRKGDYVCAPAYPGWYWEYNPCGDCQ